MLCLLVLVLVVLVLVLVMVLVMVMVLVLVIRGEARDVNNVTAVVEDIATSSDRLATETCIHFVSAWR